MSDFWQVPMLFVAALVIPWLPWDDLGFPWMYDYTPREKFRSAYNHATGFHYRLSGPLVDRAEVRRDCWTQSIIMVVHKQGKETMTTAVITGASSGIGHNYAKEHMDYDRVIGPSYP